MCNRLVVRKELKTNLHELREIYFKLLLSAFEHILERNNLGAVV